MDKQKTSLKKELEDFRERVVESELIARSNKAEYEKMHYYMLAREIAPKYLEVIEQDKEERAQMQTDFEAQLKTQVEEQNVNPVTLEDTLTEGVPESL